VLCRPETLDPVYLRDADRTFGPRHVASQCIDEVTPDEPSFLSRVWDNPMRSSRVRAAARRGALLGAKLAEAFGA
jgi:hypothetical protein